MTVCDENVQQREMDDTDILSVETRPQEPISSDEGLKFQCNESEFRGIRLEIELGTARDYGTDHRGFVF